MTAINTFRQINKRADNLLKIHQKLAPHGKPGIIHSDLLRAAVVLSVAGLDFYIHEKVCEEVPQLIRVRVGKQLPGKLAELIKKEATHDKLIEILFKDRPLSHVSSIVRRYLNNRTFQDPGKIEDALQILGLTDLWFCLGQQLSVSKEEAKLYVEQYVDRRNGIAHRGDLGKTRKSKNKVSRITRDYAQKCVESISNFVESIEIVIEDKLEHQ
jgi:hypothetical protein